ncbi:MAG: DNA gyrase C-terminal beta-propeller domain-containing protein, partial [Acidaminococcaceae bacterium]
SRIVSLVVVPETGEVLCASANGYGKRTPVDDFPTKKRGGKGVINLKITEKTGMVVGVRVIVPQQEVMLITAAGIIIRIDVNGISQFGRNAQGVRLISLNSGDKLVALAAVQQEEVDVLLDK